MSIKVMNRVWHDAPYTEGTLLCLLALADWSDEEGFCWPKIEQLERKSRLSRSGVKFCLKRLVDTGDLKIIQESTGPGVSKKYQLGGQYLTPLEEKGVSKQQKGGQLANPNGVSRHHRNKEEPSVIHNRQEPSVILTAEAKKPISDFELTAPPEKDTRYKSFLEILYRFYEWTKQKVPMYAADFDQLKKFLSACPSLSEQEFKTWLGNYARSDEVNLATAPRALLPKLGTYAPGPLNKYGRPKDAEIEPESKEARLIRKNREVLERMAAKENSSSTNGSALFEGSRRRTADVVGQHSRTLLAVGD